MFLRIRTIRYRTLQWFRRGGRSIVIGAVLCAALVGSTAIALPHGSPQAAGADTRTSPRHRPVPHKPKTHKPKPHKPAKKHKHQPVTPKPVTPTPPPQPPAPTAVEGSRIGIATGAVFWGESAAARDAEFADLQSMGVHWVRTLFPWDSIEAKAAGTYKWDNADAIVAEARAHNIAIIADIIGAPTWSVPGMTDSQTSDYGVNPSLYAGFVAAFAQRYAPQGVTIYELGNEPNHVRPGNPTPNPASYAAVLCATNAAVKRVVPQSTVLTGGLGGTTDGGGAISGPTFVRGLYAANAKGCFDGISYHPYTYPQIAPDDGARGWTGMLTVRQIMVDNGDSDKKIWATEYGAPTNGPSATRSVSEAEQATILTTAYTVFNSYSWAGALCWFDYQDKGTDASTQKDWFGLRRADGSAKPSYAALAALGHAAAR